MKVIKSSATLLNPVSIEQGWNLLSVIENAARVSHRSEDLSPPEADTRSRTEKFLRAVVLGHGDWSVVEHASASVEFIVDRGISHEIVRHRLFGYTQESTRFVNYAKKMPPSFIYPVLNNTCEFCLSGNEAEIGGLDGQYDFIHRLNQRSKPAKLPCSHNFYWMESVNKAESCYKKLLAEGWRPQEARSVLPNALACKLIMTGNLRAWRWFLLARTTLEAHPQMREVTIPLLESFKQNVPILFEDIEANERQIVNFKKAH